MIEGGSMSLKSSKNNPRTMKNKNSLMNQSKGSDSMNFRKASFLATESVKMTPEASQSARINLGESNFSSMVPR